MGKRQNLTVSFLVMVLTLILLDGCTGTEPQADWPYPRHDLANTGANPTVKCQLLDNPTMLWEITFPEGEVPWSLFPVVADIDNDGRSEYIIGGWDRSPAYWLYAYNIEDGSVRWKRYVDRKFYWSTPVVVDVNKDGNEEIVLATDNQVMALNGKDGTPIWEQPFKGAGMGMTVADVN